MKSSKNSFGLGLVARQAWRVAEVIGELQLGPRLSQANRWTLLGAGPFTHGSGAGTISKRVTS